MKALERMLREIAADARATSSYTGRPTFSERVMAAMRAVPRHEFVPEEMRRYAYENRPLTIGRGQTISQPYIVALMTDLLEIGAADVVLEIGTGSGYQTAVLAHLAQMVYSVEIIADLGGDAAARLERLGYTNVRTRLGDGRLGWPEHGPYAAIMVTAAAPEIPSALVAQLGPGGRMAIPVGSPYGAQELVLIEKGTQGAVRERGILPVAFVPLTGPGD